MTEFLTLLDSKFTAAVTALMGVLLGTYIRSFVDDRITSKLGPLINHLDEIGKRMTTLIAELSVLERSQNDHARRLERLEDSR